MIEFIKPTIEIKEISKGEATFTVEPLVRGYGTTLGNALRRVLYATLPGAAIVGVKIKGVKHEFSTVPGVKEDVAEIILNLKEVAVKAHLDSFERATVTLSKDTQGVVKAKDIKVPSDIEIMNGDLVICNLSEGASIDMELTIASGEGYVPAQNNKKADMPIGYIPIDSSFSPVKFATYEVIDTRVAQTIDYDKLVLTVKTDATATPTEVVSLAAKILVDHLGLFIDMVDNMSSVDVLKPEEDEVEDTKEDIAIEQLDLSARPLNCLKRANINMVSQLLELTEEELDKIKNLGKKSAKEIIDKLSLMGYSLKKAD